jgi:hypothetical protein
MHSKSAQGNETVQGERPEIMFARGAEKCGLGNEVLD